MKTFEQLVDIFYDNARQSFDIDYNNEKSIRRANENVNRYRKAAEKKGRLYPESIEEFSNLLLDCNKDVALCAAICLVELMPHSKQQSLKAFQIVEQYLNNCDEAMKWGLEQWLKMHSL